MMNKKTILFELNEVPLQVLETYIERHPQSTFALLTNKGTILRTETPDSNWLHPWCTWPTLHRGVDTEKHMLTNLSQNLTEVDAEYPPVWKILAKEGAKIGLAGSLHSWPMPDDIQQYDFYLPDTFASDAQAHPVELRKFQEFNLSMVDKSARNVSTGVSVDKAAALLPHLLKLGFSFSTAYKVASQLISERTDKNRKSRRRILHGVLAFDVFFSQLKRTKPDFVTFFTNHVASSMHRYWAAAYPTEFQQNEFDSDWIQTYANEIDFAMSQTDSMLDRLVNFVHKNPEYSLLVSTSMGQGANLGKAISKQVFVKDASTFMNVLGVDDHSWSRRRVMLPRFAVIVSEDKNEQLCKIAQTLRVAGKKVKHEMKDGGFHMFHFGMEDIADENAYIEFNNHRYTFDEAGLENTEIEDKSGSSGYHITSGLLMSYNPLGNGQGMLDDAIDTREIVPFILNQFDISRPSYMKKSTINFA